MPLMTGVWQKHGKEIQTWRFEEGKSLQIIADHLNLSKERVRQLLEKHCGTTKLKKFLTRRQVAESLGYSETKIRNLEKANFVKPIRSGKYFLYRRKDLEKIRKLLIRYCKNCGKEIPRDHHCFCKECSQKYRKYSYPFFNKERRKKRAEHTKNWIKKNPDKAKKIQNRALQKYLEKRRKKHYSETYYEVTQECILPLGTMFKAEKCVNSYLILSDGTKISLFYVKRITNER